MNNLDIIHERLGGKRYERYVATLCPFHNDTKPSFFVYSDRYFCAACGARGKTESLVRNLDSIPQAFVYRPAKTTSNPFTRWLTQLGSIQRICNTSSKRCSVYLRDRGISNTIQQQLKLGVLEDWIIFPIHNHYSEIIGAVARRIGNNPNGAKYILPSGQNPNLLYVPSWRNIKEQKEIFVTFGIVDAISLYILGKASASTTTGQHINVDAFSGIHKKITFVPDELEEKSAYQLASKLGLRGSVKILDYPYGTKDPADLFVYNRQLLEAAL